MEDLPRFFQKHDPNVGKYSIHRIYWQVGFSLESVFMGVHRSLNGPVSPTYNWGALPVEVMK